MKTSFITKVFVFVSFLVLSMSAQSEDLSQALIDKYADSIKFLKSSDDKHIKAIEEKVLSNPDIDFDLDENGQFSIVRNLISSLDAKSVEALSDAVEDLGFSSLDSWALIGDKVGGAMAAINLQNEPVDLSEMTPEMIAMMPESMRADFEDLLGAIEAVKNIPEADIELVRKNFSKLSVLMQ